MILSLFNLLLDIITGIREIRLIVTPIIYVYGLKRKRSSKFFYIGITNSVQNRKKQHISEARQGIHKNKALQEILRKYDDIELVVIDKVSQKNSQLREKQLIHYYLKQKHPLVNIKR